LGEPLVHLIKAGRETLIYNYKRGDYIFIYGTYEWNELVFHLKNLILIEIKNRKYRKRMGIFLLLEFQTIPEL
jgi:hypothetical protein